MITLKNVTLRRGANVLLEHVDWTIYHKQRVGMIGANGSGKTSLFKLLLGELHPDVGDLEIPKQLRLAHVAQETPAYAHSALDFVLDGDTELRTLEQALQAADAAHDGVRMGTLYEKLSIIDAYTAPSRAGQLLAGLGFSVAEQEKPVNSFSGGWRVRLNLARALMCRSDVLLLDEPTNHLDLDAVLWLEQWLKQYHGTLILISHDRDFLDAIVDHVVHLSQQRLKLYAGNYSTFEKNYAAELLMQQATYDKQQRHLAHLQSFVERFRAKASKARQAQSRLKAIARMDLVCAVQTKSDFQFEFKEPKPCANPMIHLHEVNVGYGEHIVLQHLNMSIAPKERIAILGPNGAGKSTFIKLLASELQAMSGERTVSAGLKIGYFAQHQVDHLQLDETPLLHLRRIAERSQEVDLRKFLGGFGFSGDRVLEPVRHFSGGEKSRLALALIVWQQPNLLLLDEPTNHLDLEMRNALSLALQEYDGAMILVSHDRFLVRTTTDQLMLVAEGQLQPFEGDLQEYQKWLLDFRKQQQTPKVVKQEVSSLSKKEQRQHNAKVRELLRPLVQKIERLEKEIGKCEKAEDAIEVVLADASLYEEANKAKLQQQLQEQTAIKRKLEQLEAEWLSVCAERDALSE